MDETEAALTGFADRLRLGDLPEAALEAARLRITDSLACALGALDADTVRACRQLAPPVRSGRRARLFGVLDATSVEHATLANAAAVRYLDISDAYLMTSTAHPSDNIPGVLALTEALGGTGADALLATVIAYEAHCALCDASPFSNRGWDQPIAAAPAMALAAARLLGLDREGMRNAVAIAVVSNVALGQTRHGQLSMWKGMAGPHAAREGVYAALLAEAGMTGPETPFHGPQGLWAKTLGAQYAVHLPDPSAAPVFAVQKTNIKLYPVRDAIQLPIVAALALRERLDVARIDTLQVTSYRHGFERWLPQQGFRDPGTRESADHSLPFCLAAALLDGRVDAATFADRRYLDADVRALMQRIHIDFSDEFDAVAPATRSCRLRARSADGCEVEETRIQTPDDVLRGPDGQAFRDKFHTLCATALGDAQREALLRALHALPEANSVAPIIELTRCRTPPGGR
jgi:2-methylcitrate dehydratase